MLIGKSLGGTEWVWVPVDPVKCGACGREIGVLDTTRIIRSGGIGNYHIWVVYRCDNCDHVIHFSAKRGKKK